MPSPSHTLSAIVFSFIGLTMMPLSAAAQAPVRPLADQFVTLWESPDPQNLYGYSPGLAVLPSGRLVATMDIGGPATKSWLPEHLGKDTAGRTNRGLIFTSDDQGRTWTRRGKFPFIWARPFAAGKSLYVIGCAGELLICRSDDDGLNWSEAVPIAEDAKWHQSACNVWYTRGNVYLVMERRVPRGIKGWDVGNIAPVLMRAPIEADLTRSGSWTFASDLVFEDVVDTDEIDYLGIPFFKSDKRVPTPLAPRRGMSVPGWLETNVVQIVDPDHVWFDPSGRTFHLFMRAHTGMTNIAAMCKVVENEDGTMTTSLETAPSGKPIAYLPFPGGQMRFHVVYDEKARLYWLLGSQSTDSTIRPDRMGADRYGLPDNERHRLVLHFSKNMVDWCFAGVVAMGKSPREARHYASMAIHGEDLCILSRSGDSRAKSAHDGNLITFHVVRDFRNLVY